MSARLASFLPEGVRRLALLGKSGFPVGDVEQGRAMLSGIYAFAANALEANPQTIFTLDPPSSEFAAGLYGFGWLDDFAALHSNVASTHARLLVAEWMSLYPQPDMAWQPDIAARRLISWMRHTALLLSDADETYQKQFSVALAKESSILAKRAKRAQGAGLISAAVGLVLAGMALARPAFFRRGHALLEKEIARQILPDGGHVSRNPEMHWAVFLDLALCQEVLAEFRGKLVKGLPSALDRMRPMLRFFSHGDGKRAVFHGGNEGISAAALLAPEKGREAFTPSLARQSGFCRLEAEKSVVIADIGTPPARPWHKTAHASPLAFEFSAAKARLVVNCGAENRHERWRRSWAHSGLLMESQSAFHFSASGALSAEGKCDYVEHDKKPESEKAGQLFEATHGFYAGRFGRLHERRLFLRGDGGELLGQDRLLPAPLPRWWQWRRWRFSDEVVHFSVLFHLHPDVLTAKAGEGTGIFLRPPSGGLWRFDARPLTPVLEPDSYCGSGRARASQKLVLRGVCDAGEEKFIWRFRRME